MSASGCSRAGSARSVTRCVDPLRSRAPYNRAVDEFALIERHFRRAPRDPAVRVGIGDDGAVIAPTPGMELVLSVDMLVEGRHFLAGTDPARLGHKTLAVNLSDLAAMGATPRFALLAGALPDADDAMARRVHARFSRAGRSATASS